MHTDLGPARRRLSLLAALCLLVLLPGALAGCKKAPPSADADAKLFASAPPEIKAVWDGALAAIQTNDLGGAFLALRQLRSQPGVTPSQTAAIDAHLKSINLQLATAAQNGDTNAKQIFLQLGHPSRRRDP